MNKEQAIAKIWSLVDASRPDDFRNAILAAQADEVETPPVTPTVLTREMINGVIDRERCRCGDPIRDQSQVVGMRRLATALLALGPVVVEGAVECSNPKFHEFALRHEGKLGPVAACPYCGTRLQGGEG